MERIPHIRYLKGVSERKSPVCLFGGQTGEIQVYEGNF